MGGVLHAAGGVGEGLSSMVAGWQGGRAWANMWSVGAPPLAFTMHLVFIVRFLRKPQPTPVWYWFIILNAAFWLWVAGRFMETIVYLFLPINDDAYEFAAIIQYIGNTAAAISFAIWNLYLAGHDELASSGLLRPLYHPPYDVCLP